VLVTGAAGFVGSWLLPELARAGHALVAADRAAHCAPRGEIPDLRQASLDVCDPAATQQLVAAVAAVRPRAVVHLAALAAPAEASADPTRALETNYLAVHHMVCALRARAPRARLLLVSTGEVYGRRAAGAPPAREQDPLAPSNLYAATKAAAEQRAVLAVEREGLDVVRVRPFNHTGPGRPTAYAEGSFAQQIAQAERAARAARVRVGNLAPIRDWSDVRDIVQAYRLLLEQGEPGEVYNACSGQGRSVAEVLAALRAHARVPVESDVDPARYEPVAPERLALLGDPGKLLRLGWAPRHSFASTLASLLDDFRARA
jgi:GDP-4-dehydro-6-deoxy-D-mannose reductase